MTRMPASAAAATSASGEDTARKIELLARLLDYSAEHGLSAMSLRPLAAAVESSPRMLLYFFGSKEGLIPREVLIHSRQDQQRLAEQWLEEAKTPAERVERLWQWLADPKHAGIERLFFESYARSLHDEGGAWSGFGKASVSDRLPMIDRLLATTAKRSRRGPGRCPRSSWPAFADC